MDKFAVNNHPIHELLRRRWSPRAFSSQPVESDKLLSLFEAARWSPSAANTQPWYFIVATQDDPEEFSKLLAVLTERNQRWAKSVPVLLLAVARRVTDDGHENRWASYDLGQSMAHLSIQATNLGLSVHQMAGLDPARARDAFGIPEGYEAITAGAIGYPGEPNDLPEDLRDRELAERSRKELTEFVFEGAWEKPYAQTGLEAAGIGPASRN